MRLTVTAFITTALFIAACDDAQPVDGDPEAALPGDIDFNTENPGGKADGWDYANDPARLSQRLEYKLAALPQTGKLDKPVWKDRYPQAVGKAPVAWSETYWPTSDGSTNNRWISSSEKSPLEKYDAAFNAVAGCATQPAQICGATAKADWAEYFKCAGPAAKWQMQSFQSIYQQIDGVDNDKDGETDECDDSDDEGAQGWWGLCHAWTPAALLEPEPQKAVTYNGVTFEVSDIKALIMTVYDRNEAMMLGGRCNAKTFDPDNTTSANDKCFDSNPGAMHVVLTNFLGINDSAIAMDKTASFEVWNQPITGYTVTQQEKVTATRANQCIGATGDKYTFNKDAKELYEVTMNVEYLVEGGPSRSPLGAENWTRYDSYHYVLELGSTGKIIGGRYCTDSEGKHPDFLWAPVRVSTSSAGRNPSVSLEKIQTLINLSFQADAPVTGANTKSYENTTATAIPDNNTTGATVTITVPDTFTLKTLSVSFDIAHTWVGDLRVELMKDNKKVATLHDLAGGSQQNLTLTKVLTATELGVTAGKGAWALKVTDTEAQDSGSIKSLKLVFGL